MNFHRIAALIFLVSFTAAAQDPALVAADHYRVIYEDATIRVLRVTYGPGERSVMHEHPIGTCGVFLTEFHGQSTDPEGRVTTEDHEAGEVGCGPSRPGVVRHLPENIGDRPFEVILFERKLADSRQVRGYGSAPDLEPAAPAHRPEPVLRIAGARAGFMLGRFNRLPSPWYHPKVNRKQSP